MWRGPPCCCGWAERVDEATRPFTDHVRGYVRPTPPGWGAVRLPGGSAIRPCLGRSVSAARVYAENLVRARPARAPLARRRCRPSCVSASAAFCFCWVPPMGRPRCGLAPPAAASPRHAGQPEPGRCHQRGWRRAPLDPRRVQSGSAHDDEQPANRCTRSWPTRPSVCPAAASPRLAGQPDHLRCHQRGESPWRARPSPRAGGRWRHDDDLPAARRYCHRRV